MQVTVVTRKTQHELPVPVKLILTIAIIGVLGSLAVTNAVAVIRPARAAMFDRSGPALVQASGTEHFDMANAAPGETQTADTTITYEGEGLARPRVFATVDGTGLGRYLYVTILSGSGEGAAFSSAGPIFQGRMSELPTSLASGIVDPEAIGQGESRTYRITVTMMDENAAQGLEANATFSWGTDAA